MQVDRYLSPSPENHDGPRGAVALAMREYELESQAWNVMNSLSGPGVQAGTLQLSEKVGKAIDEDPEIAKCPSARQIIAHADQSLGRLKIRNPGSSMRVDMIANWARLNPSLLWTCASAQVAEAERLLAQH